MYRCIFHGTGNSAQLCQNFGIPGGGEVSTLWAPLGTPLMETSCHIRISNLFLWERTIGNRRLYESKDYSAKLCGKWSCSCRDSKHDPSVAHYIPVTLPAFLYKKKDKRAAAWTTVSRNFVADTVEMLCKGTLNINSKTEIWFTLRGCGLNARTAEGSEGMT
jgi:hypothetical protein